MARLPRLSLAGVAHLVLLRGHNGQAVFRDDQDRKTFLDALQAAFAQEHVALHAYALAADRVWLLCTPSEGSGLSRAMQSVGRRFASAFNRRYLRSGSLWDGRYRSTVIEPGRTLLDTLVFVDRLPTEAMPPEGDGAAPSRWSSALQHIGFEGPVALKDTAEYWALGNTPFERAAAYRALLSESPAAAEAERIETAAQKGWALGSNAFLEWLQTRTERPLRPRQRGRPRRS